MVDTSPLIPQGDEGKIGHKICGCCCDSRRAVLIYSIIFVIFNIIALILSVNYYCTDYQSITSAVIAILVVGIIIRFITIGGACMYNKWMVGLGATWEVINVILSIVYAVRSSVNGTIFWSYCNNGCTYYSTPTWLSIVWTLFWSGLILYSEVVFINEVNKGIMSAQTKKREDYSCCCTGCCV